MSRTTRASFVASAVALAFFAVHACGSSTTPMDPELENLDAAAPPDEAELDGGCQRVALDLDGGGPIACQADWLCADSGVLTFECGSVDGGSSCVCITGLYPTLVTPSNDPCQAATIVDDARSLCGWNVP